MISHLKECSSISLSFCGSVSVERLTSPINYQIALMTFPARGFKTATWRLNLGGMVAVNSHNILFIAHSRPEARVASMSATNEIGPEDEGRRRA
jgi:hypothetical protein